MNLEWTQPAIENLSQIHKYVSDDSIDQANALIERLVVSAQQLKIFPSLGRVIPEYEPRENLRELISGSYRIQYQIDESVVYVLAVLHSARALPQEPPTVE